MLPKLLLYSDQPISPSLVMTLKNENIRQPASQRSVSMRATFKASPEAVIVRSVPYTSPRAVTKVWG